MSDKTIAQICGENIKRVRKSKKLSRPELSALTNIPATTITSIERGVREPNLERLLKIADALGTTINELLGDTAFDTQKARRAVIMIQAAYCLLEVLPDEQIKITVPFKLQRDADGKITIDETGGAGSFMFDAKYLIQFVDDVVDDALRNDITFRQVLFHILREKLPPADVDRLPTK